MFKTMELFFKQNFADSTFWILQNRIHTWPIRGPESPANIYILNMETPYVHTKNMGSTEPSSALEHGFLQPLNLAMGGKKN